MLNLPDETTILSVSNILCLCLEIQQAQKNKVQEIHVEKLLEELQRYRELLESRESSKTLVCSDAQTTPYCLEELSRVNAFERRTDYGTGVAFDSRGVQATVENFVSQVQPSNNQEGLHSPLSVTLDEILGKHVLEGVKQVEQIVQDIAHKFQQLALQDGAQKIPDILKDYIKLATGSCIEDQMPQILEKVLKSIPEGVQLKQKIQVQPQNRLHQEFSNEQSSSIDGCPNVGFKTANTDQFETSQESGLSRVCRRAENHHKNEGMVDAVDKVTKAKKQSLSLEAAQHFLHLQQQLVKERRYVNVSV